MRAVRESWSSSPGWRYEKICDVDERRQRGTRAGWSGTGGMRGKAHLAEKVHRHRLQVVLLGLAELVRTRSAALARLALLRWATLAAPPVEIASIIVKAVCRGETVDLARRVVGNECCAYLRRFPCPRTHPRSPPPRDRSTRQTRAGRRSWDRSRPCAWYPWPLWCCRGAFSKREAS